MKYLLGILLLLASTAYAVETATSTKIISDPAAVSPYVISVSQHQDQTGTNLSYENMEIEPYRTDYTTRQVCSSGANTPVPIATATPTAGAGGTPTPTWRSTKECTLQAPSGNSAAVYFSRSSGVTVPTPGVSSTTAGAELVQNASVSGIAARVDGTCPEYIVTASATPQCVIVTEH